MSHTNGIYRNSLGEAYQHAEGLYSNAVSLSQLLDAWSKRSNDPELTPSAADHLTHNLLNARANLTALESALAVHLPQPQELVHA